jgi:O-succinylbenzoic acid--CoA ligase
MELPGVIEALVVPVPDEEFGHRPAAFVRFYRGIPIDLPALCARLKEKIARFKVPDYCLPWPDEPPMRGGKLDRHSFRLLALQLIEAQGLRR